LLARQSQCNRATYAAGSAGDQRGSAFQIHNAMISAPPHPMADSRGDWCGRGRLRRAGCGLPAAPHVPRGFAARMDPPAPAFSAERGER
jgi:hypothetical protein